MINYNNSFSENSIFVSDIRKINTNKLIKILDLLKINVCNNNKSNVIFLIIKKYLSRNIKIAASGILEVLSYGYGFLRCSDYNYLPNMNDIYVSAIQIKNLDLKTGDNIICYIGYTNNRKFFFLKELISVNNIKKKIKLVSFENLTPIYPKKKIILEILDKRNIYHLNGRIIDLVSPIGLGQRALIVAPPKTGKTILLKSVAYSIMQNYPNIVLIMLSIGERPEEVTDMSHFINGQVLSSTFDQNSYKHIQIAELALARAQRLVESKNNVVILLDSITRLARAYNDITRSSGKVLTGGIESSALQRPKKFFGSARNLEEGGSLTIIGTALIDTGSRMDDVIFEEFKGTGNSEIILDRRISNRRIFPAINIFKSGTRREELFTNKKNYFKINLLKNVLCSMNPSDAISFLIKKINQYESNADLLRNI